MTDAELRALLVDCLALWGVSGNVTAGNGAAEIGTPAGRFGLRHAAPNDRPVRWFLQTPDREALGHGPRALPSIVAALSTLRRRFAPTDSLLSSNLSPIQGSPAESNLIASLGTKGSASVDSFTEQFSETPARVPEPSSLALLGAGLAVLPFRPCRRGRG